PELSVFSLGDGLFLIDDSSMATSSSTDPNDAEPGEDGGESGGGPMTAFNYTCGLWLSITATNDLALLKLHNTRSNQSYTIWSLTNIALTNWVWETNVTGASGDLTYVGIAMGQRSNLFLRAWEYRDYVTNFVFQGLSYSNTMVEVADTMGAVGPNHFV